MRTIKGKKVIWLDILKPNEKDVAKIKRLSTFHPIILDELLAPSAHTRIDDHKDYLFIAFHIPVYDRELKTSRRAEIDFLITKNAVLSTHYENLIQIDELFQEIAQDKELQIELLSGDSIILLHAIFLRIISFARRQLRHIEENLTIVGQRTYGVSNQEILNKISSVKRDILEYHLIAHPQEKLFKEFIGIGTKFWGSKSSIYLHDLESENQPVHSNLENYLKIIESLETTNTQLINIETNKVIKRFTVGAFLFSFAFFFVFLQAIPYVNQFTLASPITFWGSFLGVLLIIFIVGAILIKKKLF